jgi:hypothetical protein
VRLKIEAMEDRTVPALVAALGPDSLGVAAQGAGAGAAQPDTVQTRPSDPTATDVAAGAATTTTLAASAPTVTAGQPVTLTATVTAPGGGSPTGSVVFRDLSGILGTVPLQGGTATYTLTSLPPGPDQVEADYQGDASFAESASVAVPLSQELVASTLTLTSSDDTIVGQPITFTAQVTPATPGAQPATGTVTFMDGTQLLGSGSLVDGAATFQTSSLPAGAHTITASYSGDGAYAPSESAPLSQTLVAPYTVSISGPSQPTAYGQPVTLTAHVAPAAGQTLSAGSAVTFLDGTKVLGTANLDANGDTTLTLNTPSVGQHVLTAVYHADTDYTSTALTQTVQKATTTTGLTTSAPYVTLGQNVTLTATVAAPQAGTATPTGSVTFRDGSAVLGTATVVNGTAMLTRGSLAAGTHSLTAAYSGDANFAGSTSGTVSQTVTYHPPVVPVTTLTSSAPGAAPGQTVTFTARVSLFPIGIPTQVTFRDGSTVLGTVPLGGNGFASFSTNTLGLGHHAVTASFSGGGSVTASTSAALDQIIQPASTTTLTASTASPAFGQAVTLTATVAATAGGAVQPAGSVTFKDGSTILGTATLQNGVATLSTARLSFGNHRLSVVYAGSSLFLGSSAAQYVNIRAAATSMALQPPAVTSNGATLTLTATVAVAAPGAGNPSGQVTFYDGSTSLGTATVTNGKATLQVAKLGAGNHNLNATYNGTVGYAASRSAVVRYAVPSLTVATLQAPAAALGQQATLKAVVAAVAPGVGKATGTVTFMDGTTALGTANLSDGVASLRVTWKQGVGPHTLTAVFNGSGAFTASTSAPLAYTVQKSPAVVTLRSYLSGAQAVTLRANVEVPGNWSSPTGTITFMDGSTVLGTVNVQGSALVTLSNLKLSKGTHALTAVYSGDGSFLSESTNLVVQV